MCYQNKIQICHLKEYEYYDGECFIEFFLLNQDKEKNTVNLAISDKGRIQVKDFDLYQNDIGTYFEYGPMLTKLFIKDFDDVEECIWNYVYQTSNSSNEIQTMN